MFVWYWDIFWKFCQSPANISNTFFFTMDSATSQENTRFLKLFLSSVPSFVSAKMLPYRFWLIYWCSCDFCGQQNYYQIVAFIDKAGFIFLFLIQSSCGVTNSMWPWKYVSFMITVRLFQLWTFTWHLVPEIELNLFVLTVIVIKN